MGDYIGELYDEKHQLQDVEIGTDMMRNKDEEVCSILKSKMEEDIKEIKRRKVAGKGDIIRAMNRSVPTK